MSGLYWDLSCRENVRHLWKSKKEYSVFSKIKFTWTTWHLRSFPYSFIFQAAPTTNLHDHFCVTINVIHFKSYWGTLRVCHARRVICTPLSACCVMSTPRFLRRVSVTPILYRTTSCFKEHLTFSLSSCQRPCCTTLQTCRCLFVQQMVKKAYSQGRCQGLTIWEQTIAISLW